MAKNIQKWGGWKKVEKPEAPPFIEPLPTPDKPLVEKKGNAPLAVDRLKKIDTNILKKQAQLKYSERISKINKVKIPKICEYCGNDINTEHFVIYSPQKKYICRGCKQSPTVCGNCKDVIINTAYGKKVDFCKECTGPLKCNICDSKVTLQTLVRIKDHKGIYCQRCMREQEKCFFCAAPYSKALSSDTYKYPICDYCSGSSLTTQSQVDEIMFNIKDFMFQIHLGFDTDIKDIDAILPSPGLTPQETSFIFSKDKYYTVENNTIYPIYGIPSLLFTNIVLDEYAKTIFPFWKKVGKNTKMIVLLTIFLKMNYYDREHIFHEYESLKKEGLKHNKSFQPLYQASYKNGPKQGFMIIKQLLDR